MSKCMGHEAELFVERGTDYQMEHATLSVYETNCPCRGVEFIFDKHMLTLMLSGHKTIWFNEEKFEFFPGTLYIPEKHTVQRIDISSASLTNPTKCLVLDIHASFIEKFLDELMIAQSNRWLGDRVSQVQELSHFLSNDEGTIACFKRLYQYQLEVQSRADELITEMVLRELVLRIFKTEGLAYLLDICRNEVDENIQASILYIRSNLTHRVTIDQLAQLAGLGKTSYFNKFKQATGMTPINYILQERIKYAKSLIAPTISLQEVAFRSGFNTYEHFCKSFKKIEEISPLKYKKIKATKP